jgi:hypothetical protein
MRPGEVPERPNGTVLKTVVGKLTQGSNPCLSATFPLIVERSFGVVCVINADNEMGTVCHVRQSNSASRMAGGDPSCQGHEFCAWQCGCGCNCVDRAGNETRRSGLRRHHGADLCAVALTAGAVGASTNNAKKPNGRTATTTTTTTNVLAGSNTSNTSIAPTTTSTSAPDFTGAVYLSDLVPSSGGGLLDKGDLDINGESFPHSIAVNAVGMGCSGGCNVDYDLPKEAKRFVATLARYQNNGSSDIFLWVYADDERLASINIPPDGAPGATVDVDVTGHKVLQLRGSASVNRVTLGTAMITTH